jgi:hypothetical protein
MRNQFRFGLMLLAFSSIGFAQTPTNNDHAYAQRGNRLLVLGGAVDADKTTGKTKSHNNQIIELDTGKLQALPALPSTAHPATVPITHHITQAAWINDDSAAVFTRVLNDQGLPEAQWFGTLNVKSNKYTALPTLPRNRDAQGSQDFVLKLIGATADHAFIVAEDGLFTRVHIKSGGQTTLSPLLRKRNGYVGRVLPDGRVVIAGGQVESEMVLARERGCGAPTTAPCVEKYTGFGQRLPSRRHEMFDPVTNTWRNSAPSRASGGSAAVLPNGRVAKLGDFTTSAADPNDAKRKIETTTALLEISAEDGQSWRRIVLPPPMTGLFSSAGIEVVAVADANGLLDRGLFLKVSIGDGTAQSAGLGTPKDPVWWWLADVDDAKTNWQIVNRDRNLGVAPKIAGAEKSKLHVWPSMNGAALYAK